MFKFSIKNLNNKECVKFLIAFVFFNISFPFFGIFFNSTSSLFFPSFDFIFFIILVLIFFLIPFFLILFVFFCFKNKIVFINILYFLFLLFFFKQLEHHLSEQLQYYGNIILRIILIFIFSSFLYSKIKINNNIVKKISNIIIFIGIFSSAYFIYMSFNVLEHKKKIENFKNLSHEVKKKNFSNKDYPEKIFILTFEKLSRDLLIQNNDIKNDYKGLKKLSNTSDIFYNFNAVSPQTSYSLRALYTGKFINNYLVDDKKQSIFKLLNKNGYTVNYMNDYINYPCLSIYVQCFKSDRKVNLLSRTQKLTIWVYKFFVIYLPDIVARFMSSFFLDKITNQENIFNAEFHELNRNVNGEETVFFETIERNIHLKSAFIFHFFLSDGTTDGDNISEEKLNKLDRFDKFIINFENYLRSNNNFHNSLIFISSDTGSDKTLRLFIEGKAMKEIEYTENQNKIFTLIKTFNQKKGVKIKKEFNQFEFYEILKKLISKKELKNEYPSKYNYNNILLIFSGSGNSVNKFEKKDDKWIKK